MTQLGEAIARYHKIIESDSYKGLEWAEALQEQMRARHLGAGSRPIAPVLRPHFLTRRQYTNMAKAAEALFSAIDRVKQAALSNPSLLSRMGLLPAEKMLASVDPGYPYLAVTSLLDTSLNNGSLQFVQYTADTPAGVAYGDALAEIFYDSPPMKEFRKRYSLSKVGGSKHLLHALLKAYKVSGKKQYPRIAILEFRQPFQTAESPEYVLLAEQFRREGYPTEVVTPDQLDYRGGVLRRGDFAIDLVYRRVKVHEFLVRFDLSHPLVRAYRDGAACVVNSFRAELAHKKAIFDLLTDDSVTSSFPAAERKAIREHIPWTRVVAATKATYQDHVVELPEFIRKNREKLVLKPNDESTDLHAVRGWETGESAWERALRAALRNPYVVQERVEPASFPFPLLQFGKLEVRDMQVDVQPHVYLGKVHGCSSWLTSASGFSTVGGLTPTYILESKS